MIQVLVLILTRVQSRQELLSSKTSLLIGLVSSQNEAQANWQSSRKVFGILKRKKEKGERIAAIRWEDWSLLIVWLLSRQLIL